MAETTPASIPTLLYQGTDRLRALCLALGYEGEDERRVLDVFDTLAATWGTLPADGTPRWTSDITDDHTPFEFSLAIDPQPELRLLVEAQDPDRPSLRGNWNSGLALNAALQARFGASLERFHAIEDLFTPADPFLQFGIWHAAACGKGAAPEFKIYLNPQARGRDTAPALVRESLIRLGFVGAYESLPVQYPLDELKYFSLDLSARKGARVKIYTAHHEARAERIEEAVSVARDYVPHQASEFCSRMSDSAGPYRRRPVITCLSFADGNPVPTTGTIHFPIRDYADDDRVARNRILRMMDEGATIYWNAISAFANRPLEEGIGMQTYASLRQQKGRRRITVYLAPEVYHVRAARPATAARSRSRPITIPPLSGVIGTRLDEVDEEHHIG